MPKSFRLKIPRPLGKCRFDSDRSMNPIIHNQLLQIVEPSKEDGLSHIAGPKLKPDFPTLVKPANKKGRSIFSQDWDKTGQVWGWGLLALR